jgi:hypothetical protein
MDGDHQNIIIIIRLLPVIYTKTLYKVTINYHHLLF